MKKQTNISQCPSCFCMTHTIKGKCGKCGESMKKQTWQEAIKNSIWIIPKYRESVIAFFRATLSSELARERKELIGLLRQEINSVITGDEDRVQVMVKVFRVLDTLQKETEEHHE